MSLRSSILRPASRLITTPASRVLPITTTAVARVFSITSTNMSSASLPSKMKAIQIKGDKGPASALYTGEIDMPKPAKGQVLVKVRPAPLRRACPTRGG
jgi:hypothetical protein